jgi:signal transduction histidine kinase
MKSSAPIDSSDPRVQEFFDILLRMASGEYEIQAPVSPERDLLDAVVHAVNVIVGELNLVRKEAEDADRAKSRFLANVSHEIRTPIATIIGFVDVLEGRIPPSEMKTLGRIKANGKHLLGLIDQMLDLSAIEADRLTLDPSVVELAPMFEALADGFRIRAGGKGIDFALTLGADLPRYAEIDAEKIRQIVSNLVSNAVKFTDRGGVHVTVSGQWRADSPQHLIVQVVDTGPGIPEPARELIFEPFERGEFQGTGLEGAGLGLSIAHKLAAFMTGSLELVASSHRGSVFRYTQPVVWRTHPPAGQSSQPAPRPTTFPKGIKILVAEDGQDFRSMLKYFLETAGAEVTCVADGEAALERAQRASYDLIVMDIMMPRLNGLDAAKQLRQAGYSRPLVALTALAMPEQLAECRAAGFDLALTKPTGASELIRHLSKLL